MLEVQTKIKRQIELLGLCIGEQQLTTFDLAEKFGVDEITIKRDLGELRQDGVDIHSHGKRGVLIDSPIDSEKMKCLVLQYLGLCYSFNTFDKSTGLMIRRQHERSLANVVALHRCIEGRFIAIIDYVKEAGTTERNREIQPLLIFQSDNHWRLLAKHEGKFKQYIITKIDRVQQFERRYPPVPKESIEELYRYTWRSWLGTDRFAVKLKLSAGWAKTIVPKQLMECEEITEIEDGSVIYRTVVNNLNEIAAWIISRGEGVIVLEPTELKKIVVRLAEETLKNYCD